MNLKHALAVLLLLSCHACGQGLKAVMVNSNGVIHAPTNFWAANAPNNIANLNIHRSPFANLSTEESGGNAEVTNGTVEVNIASTNTSGSAGVRLLKSVNSVGPSGVGTQYGNDSHTLFTTLTASPGANGRITVVLGKYQNFTNNITDGLTNRGIGYEIDAVGSAETNRVRLIAHNGTSLTNGPWVNIGTIFQKYTIGVKQTKGSPNLELLVGSSTQEPTVNAGASIGGGPIVNAGLGLSALDVIVSTTGTNGFNIGAEIYAAWVQVSD